jgi:hypothetical protein
VGAAATGSADVFGGACGSCPLHPARHHVQAFIRPEGQTLKMLIRVPVKGIEDVEVPRRAGEYVDFTRIDQALRDTASVFLIDNLKIYEGDTQLPDPTIVATQFSLESDASFEELRTAALAHVTGPLRLPADTSLY